MLIDVVRRIGAITLFSTSGAMLLNGFYLLYFTLLGTTYETPFMDDPVMAVILYVLPILFSGFVFGYVGYRWLCKQCWGDKNDDMHFSRIGLVVTVVVFSFIFLMASFEVSSILTMKIAG